ncbi:MAG: zinc-ribbon domain-containing protein [Clostridiales bacterium]|nr:zinc-ribbon domain-containing protein [Clostridiales bacterium]MBQ3046431.1 SPFH domain-containing protein [Clostridia bacterium]
MALFLKIIEWADNSKDTLVHKFPLPKGGREINHKSKLIVRESQQAIFVHKGQICDIFPAGTYNLNTDIFPILSKLAGWKYGFQTPISVDVYFVNTKQFTGHKWGTSNPIMMRDPEFGMIRVKGYGSYAFKVDDAGVFLKELFGTNSSFVTEDITDWLKTMLVSALTDAIGESRISALDLAGNTIEFNQIVKANIQNKFKEIGLLLTNLFIENMSVPKEVEQAIDERSKLGILGDKTDVMMKVAAAEAMKDAAKNPGMGGAFMGAGVGIGAGAGMGAVFADAFKQSNTPTPEKQTAQPTSTSKKCPSCGADIGAKSKFCPECGAKLPTKKFCSECGAELSSTAKFCPECGAKQ